MNTTTPSHLKPHNVYDSLQMLRNQVRRFFKHRNEASEEGMKIYADEADRFVNGDDWVKLEDKRPETMQLVWYIQNGETTHGTYYGMINKECQWWNCERREFHGDEGVTFWMPRQIPPQPKP